MAKLWASGAAPVRRMRPRVDTARCQSPPRPHAAMIFVWRGRQRKGRERDGKVDNGDMKKRGGGGKRVSNAEAFEIWG